MKSKVLLLHTHTHTCRRTVAPRTSAMRKKCLRVFERTFRLLPRTRELDDDFLRGLSVSFGLSWLRHAEINSPAPSFPAARILGIDALDFCLADIWSDLDRHTHTHIHVRPSYCGAATLGRLGFLLFVPSSRVPPRVLLLPAISEMKRRL